MALPSHLQYHPNLHISLTCFYRNGLSPVEVAFLAESIPISIQPRQAMTSLQLIDVQLCKRCVLL
jgi:hypothetical protein